MLKSLYYRPDIDGLRAIAIISVVLYHAFPRIVPGGFIGVDVFFVISGYLITSIIWTELDKGSFSFLDFYARRIRRIFPALIIVLITCLALGWVYLLPSEYTQLSKHVMAGLGFVSNFVYIGEGNYFDPGQHVKPLIHLWSLAIEEQFYLIWPLVLWISWRKKINPWLVALVLVLGSFYFNIRGVGDNETKFFLPQFRFWEILCGSLIALYSLRVSKGSMSLAVGRLLSNQRFANAMSIVGLLLLTVGFFYINNKLIYPRFWALIPVAGTMLLILSGSSGVVNRILSHRALIYIGLISYPLYLWHWPLITFARIVEGHQPDDTMLMGIVALSVLLACLTYYGVEKWVRNGKSSANKTWTLVALAITTAAVALYIYANGGVYKRMDRYSTRLTEIVRYLDNPIAPEEYFESNFNPVDSNRVNYTRFDDSKKILFLGDSHVEHYYGAIDSFYQKNKINVHSLPSIFFLNSSFPPNINKKYKDLIDDPSIKKVVLSFYWSQKYHSVKSDRLYLFFSDKKNEDLKFAEDYSLPSIEKFDKKDEELLTLIKKFHELGKQVYIVLDNPFAWELDPRSMIRRSWNGFSFKELKPLSKSLALSRAEPIRSRVIAIAKKTNSKIIDPFEYLCDEQYCSAFNKDGKPRYSDYNHFVRYTQSNEIHYLDSLFQD